MFIMLYPTFFLKYYKFSLILNGSSGLLLFPSCIFLEYHFLKIISHFSKVSLRQRKLKFVLTLWKQIFKILKTYYNQAPEKKTKQSVISSVQQATYVLEMLQNKIAGVRQRQSIIKVDKLSVFYHKYSF